MFSAWMNILRQVPEGVLWLQLENEITEKNLRQEAERRGVEPTRLIFSGKLLKDQHLGRLRLADVVLDTRIVNGIITTSDALWAGVPVITLQGNSFTSRVSSSILTAIGLPELIAQTLEEYESLAINLAHNLDELQTIRQKLTENLTTEPLFDTPRFARNLEKAYKEMWKIFVAGESPRQIKVVED
jgi:predicted O-linked N-acetylglucosamine transferase (SPINDLY family)